MSKHLHHFRYFRIVFDSRAHISVIEILLVLFAYRSKEFNKNKSYRITFVITYTKRALIFAIDILQTTITLFEKLYFADMSIIINDLFIETRKQYHYIRIGLRFPIVIPRVFFFLFSEIERKKPLFTQRINSIINFVWLAIFQTHLKYHQFISLLYNNRLEKQ